MEIKDIKKIIELMKANDLAEFEMEEENFRIAIKRKNGTEQQVFLSSAPAAPLAAAAPVAAPASAPAAEPAAEEEDANLVKITSPMVGTFYRSSAPDADAFVSVGDSVDEETVVCIVEAMKVMNEIKAEMKGTVKKILAENAEPVEYGQPMFLIEPA